MVLKVNEIQKWSSKIEQGSLLKENIDLSDLFHPDTFLSALAQQTAREYGVSMSDLKLQSSWSRGGMPGVKLSVKIHALELEGAMFDGVRLSASMHDSPSIQVAPTCTLAWVPDSSHEIIPVSEVRGKNSVKNKMFILLFLIITFEVKHLNQKHIIKILVRSLLHYYR